MALIDPGLIDAACQRLGWTLVHFVWQGTLVALVLAAVLRGLKQSHTRYAAACLALAVMTALPLATLRYLQGRARLVPETTQTQEVVPDRSYWTSQNRVATA